MEFRMEIKIRVGREGEGGDNRPFQNKQVWGERKKGEILGNPTVEGQRKQRDSRINLVCN